MTSDPVVVVGGGIAGVACARRLRTAGIEVRVLDRGRRLGGRMATRTVGGRPVDTGASYFTVSDRRFAAVVREWESGGHAHPWTDRFHVLGGDAPEVKQGPVRWGTPRGSRSLVEQLARGIDVRRQEVVSVRRRPGGLEVDGQRAAGVVLAMPDAQAARLLGADLQDVRGRLTRRSEPVLALTATFAERTWEGAERFDGGFVNGDDVLAWVADDGRRRGDDAPVLVAHSTPAFAAQHLADPRAARPALLEALGRVLDVGEPVSTRVQRWSLARPVGTRAATHHLRDGVGVCGDGWGPVSKVEGAWLSGDTLGAAMVRATGR
ncbi:NAD(P)/FAD-dependent oxidoreductase [Nocardioides aurantiacus]|uniref:NAD(P)/FAD-dependent oxidoreductase n=1 Tax=Nocardioides aurantiacus TaxID=86796 RepID=UPI00403F63A7